MQNFLIYILDIIGLTIGYFAAVKLRFGGIITAYGYMKDKVYLRWIVSIVVLTFVYLLFHPNRGFFKRKIIDEIRSDLVTVILTAAGIAMIAMILGDAAKYSRFIYLFTVGFNIVFMVISH